MTDPTDRFRVEFTLTADDYVDWYAFALDHDASLRAQAREQRERVRGFVVGIAFFLVLTAFLVWRERRHTGEVSAVGVIALLGVTYALCYYGRWLFVDLRKRFLAHARAFAIQGGGLPRGLQVVELSDRGLVSENEVGRWCYSWSHGVEDVVLRPGHLLVYTGFGPLVIPRAALGPPGAAEAFATEVRRRVIAAGGPEYSREVLDFVKERDVPCPECRYNLRDMVFPRCPECGLQFTGAELRRPAPETRSFRLWKRPGTFD